ncbi:MAG: serine/threonine protein kinase [Polyangiaceae bacterium]|nr:serine/threonine protein kinase [Polyangiaceae bacterium]
MQRVDTATAIAPTLSPSSVGLVGGGTLPYATPGTQGGHRTTVLPRVSVEGGMPLLVAADRERYETESQLGEGGMGEVLKVKDNDIQRTVALKRLLPGTQEPAIVARFVEEIRTVGQLEHPNIVPIHDVGIDSNGQYYFVMKYVNGETLESIIEKLQAGDRAYHARFTYEHRVEVFVGILEAIHYAHARGIVHRDIKPANVMVGPYGEVVVMDWGIAKQLRPEPGAPVLPEGAGRPGAPVPTHGAPADPRSLHRTQEGALIGTPAYMSPEQAAGFPVDERSDIYSLCVLLHELLGLEHYLAGEETMDGILRGALEKTPPALLRVRNPYQPPVPADLVHFVRKGVNKDASQRFQSVSEMLTRLRARRDGVIPIQCPVTFAKRGTTGLTRFVDRHPFVTLVSVFLVPLLVLSSVALAVWRALA